MYCMQHYFAANVEHSNPPFHQRCQASRSPHYIGTRIGLVRIGFFRGLHPTNILNCVEADEKLRLEDLVNKIFTKRH